MNLRARSVLHVHAQEAKETQETMHKKPCIREQCQEVDETFRAARGF
jgi:hypothetical protein